MCADVNLLVCFLMFYILATSMIISEHALTCDSAPSWRLYSAATLENQYPRPHDLISHLPGTLAELVEHRSCAWEIVGLNTWSSQTSDLYNWYLLLHSQVLGIITNIRLRQGLVDSVAGKCDRVGYQVTMVMEWGSTIKSPRMHSLSLTSRHPSWYDLRCC